MPLVFIRGVNNRLSDEGYAQGVAARKALFEELVVPAMVGKGFPHFAVSDDIYWGDLGVSFGWNLRSVPETRVVESLGPDLDAGENLDLLNTVAESQPKQPDSVESLGAESPLAVAAAKDPGGLVRAIFAPEADRFAPRDLAHAASGAPGRRASNAVNQGTHLGLILIAVEQLARDAGQDPSLVTGTTDNQVLDKIQSGVLARYQALAEPKLKAGAAEAADVEALGKFGDAIGWAMDHVKSAVTNAKKATNSAIATVGRGASLVALKSVRDGLSRKSLRFLGDVFVYLRHGRAGDDSIYARVRDGLLAIEQRKNDNNEPEPFVVVTHSFGSEILYDLLQSDALSGLTIDLWVTAGAQTSLFVEMSLLNGISSPLPADTSHYTLGLPPGVKKWVNFYDPADVLSYLHEPVFGSNAVTDIPVRAQGNLSNAHGHYFVDPGFYERIASEIP